MSEDLPIDAGTNLGEPTFATVTLDIKMKFIYKYKLETKPTIFLELPSGYEILSIQEQNNNIYLWALVDTDRPIVTEAFYLIGTGQMFPWEKAKVKFIDTVQLNEGSFVVHIFRDIS